MNVTGFDALKTRLKNGNKFSDAEKEKFQAEKEILAVKKAVQEVIEQHQFFDMFLKHHVTDNDSLGVYAQRYEKGLEYNDKIIGVAKEYVLSKYG
jgi:hypothetical protein